MVHAVRMPKPGQMTEECTLTSWFKREGDAVARGDILFEIETDKSAMEVESFEDGVLLRRVVAEGETVPVNAICAYVGAPGETVPDVGADAPGTMIGAVAPEGAMPEAEIPGAAMPGAAGSAGPGPIAAGVPVPPSGASPARARPEGPGTSRLAISPRASRLAAVVGLDPRSLRGTGPGGRIVERDVRAAVAAGPAPTAGPSPAPTAGSPAAPASGDAVALDEEGRRPLNRMRRVIAERLTRSWTTIPHFTITVAADVSAVAALRAELRATGTRLTLTDFVLAATARTLVEFPDVNATTDGTSIWPRRRVHLGLAVSVPGGLLVPVLRDADRLSLLDLHDRAADLAARARDGAVPVDDLTGSTFTVSNLGMHGVEEFSAIINPGEAAILAVASALPTAVAIGDGLAVRSIMKLTLSADHRLVDGELGARFLGAIRRRLEDAGAFRAEILAQ